jgi:hypothetical protein
MEDIAGLSLATNTKFKTKEEVNATKSIITSPLNGSTVEAGKSLTVNWKNNGATKEFLYITSYVNTKPKIIYGGYVTGTSKTVTIPANATGAVRVVLYSLINNRWVLDNVYFKIKGN